MRGWGTIVVVILVLGLFGCTARKADVVPLPVNSPTDKPVATNNVPDLTTEATTEATVPTQELLQTSSPVWVGGDDDWKQ